MNSTTDTEHFFRSFPCLADLILTIILGACGLLLFLVRRVPPQFSIPPEAYYEVMSGSDLNLTCVAVGSPMPYVKWRKGSQDVFPEVTPPIGKNVLTLTGIQESSNYTCVAASKLGIIERSTLVRVQGKHLEL